ncbi:hypothetical protein BDN72DRAFT_537019 [Pluteus cervinus]|uniref:Uncharacterized protein n=1 Tax=Pluteus cervinus TaxID=181527 RepID=A0ACD3A425_9AGAR|nr:hypothetical protein BDN72DRAFT_537019 [Pluteus cervinus]
MSAYLPDELVVIIFNDLSSAEFYRLIHCDHRFYGLAIPLLYRSIRGLSVDKTTSLLASLCTHDHTPPLVQSLAIDWRKVSVKEHINPLTSFRVFVKGKLFGPRKMLSNRTSLLNSVLKRTINLTAFSLMVRASDNADMHAAKILDGCSLPLTSLTTSLSCDRALMTFLRTTPNLSTLNLTYGVDHRIFRNFALDSTHLPVLKGFGWTDSVPIDQVQHFIEGRPIDKINIVIQTRQLARMLDILALSQQSVTGAFFKFRDTPDDETFILIATRLPKLRKLKITIPLLPALEKMSEIADAFRKFRSLRYITLTIKQTDSTNLIDVLLPCIRTCFFLCTTLVHLEIPQAGTRMERRGDSVRLVRISSE